MDNFEHLPETSNIENQDGLILRDRLAIVRTKLANERTLFSYIRTSLYLLTIGIGLLEIESVRHLKIIACTSLLFSVFLFFRGILKFHQMNKRLKRYLSGDGKSGTKPPSPCATS